MAKPALIAVVATLTFIYSVVAQVSPDEAMEKLKERQAAAATQPSDPDAEIAYLKLVIADQAKRIDDLKTRIDQLVAQNSALKRQAAAASQPAGAAASAAVSFDGWCRIINKGSGLDLSVISDNKNPGNGVDGTPYDDDDCQKWGLDPVVGHPAFRIVNKYSRLIISVRGDDLMKVDEDIIEWHPRDVDDNATDYDGEKDHHWIIEPLGDCFKILSESSGMCMTSHVANPKGLIQEPWHNSDEQLWFIKPLK